MLKCLVTLAIAAATVMVPQSQAPSNVRTRTQYKRTPAKPASVTAKEEKGPDEAEQAGSDEHSQDAPHNVNINEATARHRHDWFDLLSLIIAGLLVVVSGVTGAFIWYQAKETRIAAEAAQLNAQAIVNAERAWVLPYYVREFDTRSAWWIKNWGRTPASIIGIKWAVYQMNPTDQFSEGKPHHSAVLSALPNMLAPGEEWRFAQIDVYVMFSDNWEEIRTRRQLIYFWCLVEYLDVLTNVVNHQSEVTLVYNGSGGYFPTEDREHNRAT